MKRSLSLILIILISISCINSEAKSFNSLGVLTVATPINLLAIALGHELIQIGRKKITIAEDVKSNPQNNLDAIRDYCADYKESHTVTGYSNGQTVTATATNNNPSLYRTYINVKSDPEKLKDFAFLISKYMKNSANELIIYGYFIPCITLAGTLISLKQ